MLIVLDTETTGLSEHAQVVSIAAIMVGETQVEDTMLVDCVVRPLREGWQNAAETVEAFAVNGLTVEEVEAAERFLPMVWSTLAGYMRRYPTTIIAHSAKFDLRLIQQSLADWGEKPQGAALWACSRSLPWPTVRHSLDALCEHYQIQAESARHSAAGDCERLLAVMRHLHADVGAGVPFLAWLESHPWAYAAVP